MKKFQFTMGTMLHYKDALLEKEKNALMQLRAKQMAIEAEIAQDENQLSELERGMKERVAKGTTAMELRTFEFHSKNARSLIKQLEGEVDELAHDIEKQRKVVVSLSQEVSGLEKLEEKQLEEYNYDVQKEEQVRIIEIVSSKYATENPS